MAYKPPKALADKQIWTLGIAGKRKGKLPEFYYTHKKAPLLSYSSILARMRKNPTRFSGIVGIISDEILVIDVDNCHELPENLALLISRYPTHIHKSMSGTGWHIYYKCPNALPNGRKRKTFEHGDLIQGAYVTTTDSDGRDYCKDVIAEVSLQDLQQYIPKLQQQSVSKSSFRSAQLGSPEQLLTEAQRLLSKIPVNPDVLIETVFELKLTEADFSSYNYWLTVAQSLAHLGTQIEEQLPGATERLRSLFHEWSEGGTTYSGQDDCNATFDSCVAAEDENLITFNTLRKISHNYKIPITQFPVLLFDKKQNIKGIDASDPRNYIMVTDHWGLSLVQSSGQTYIKGPQSLIKYYFTDQGESFLTQSCAELSLPFDFKYRTDQNLLERLMVFFRDQGIRNCGKMSPLLAGFLSKGISYVDPVYTWISSQPWDGVKRVDKIIFKSLSIDHVKADELDVPVKFYYHLVKRHLVYMAGLRAKVHRQFNQQVTWDDRHKKSQSVLVIAGAQKKGKTTWVESLVPEKANASISVTPHSVKDTLELQRALATTFVYNIDEIDVVFNSMDPAEFKSVITQEKDSYREMYKERTKSMPRSSGFFGTTNATSLRLDRTGNRRIWIIPAAKCDANPWLQCDYQQVWAELLYEAEQLTGQSWPITDQEEALVNQTARGYMKQSLGARMIDMHLNSDSGVIYGPDDFDFEVFLDNLNQPLFRELNRKCFFTTRGHSCYKALKASTMMDPDMEINFNSFNYDVTEFCASLFPWSGQKLFTKGHKYQNGVFTLNTGGKRFGTYYFIPFKKFLARSLELREELKLQVLKHPQ